MVTCGPRFPEVTAVAAAPAGLMFSRPFWPTTISDRTWRRPCVEDYLTLLCIENEPRWCPFRMHNRKKQRGYMVLKWYGVDIFEIMQDNLDAG